MNMMIKNAFLATGAVMLTATLVPTPAMADDNVALVKCEESLGTIALVDGATAGWQQWGLGSPRMLISQIATQSGCFTVHKDADGTPARFLLTAIAGTKEEVDQGVNVATGMATDALIRSGAATGILSSVPFGGAALGMLGGLGGKKKTVSAALTVVSPATGQPLAAGTGSVRKTSISFGGSNPWGRDYAESTGYADSSEGQKLTEAFILAFNQLVEQRAALSSAPQARAPVTSASATTSATAIAAVTTAMRSAPSANAAEVRSLRTGTALTLSGKRDGLWVEVSDNFGTTGWVSVEDMQ